MSYKIYFNPKQGNVKIEEANTHCIPANKWLYLATLHSSKNITQWQHILNSGELTVVFQSRVLFNNTNVDHLDQLSKDFGQLLCDELFSDVTVKSVEGSEFKVHKYILASRSAVLKALFAHDTTETYTNIVETPFEADVLQDVLTYIYSNKVLRADEIPDKLLEVADYYQLDGLKRLCTQKLYERLTAENAIDTLQLADRYHIYSLRDLTLLFLKDKASRLLKKSKTWAKIESVPLLRYACKWLAENNDDSDTDGNNS